MIGLRSLDYPNARVVDELDLSALPEGTTTHLLMALVHDGLGRPMRLPVIAARGKKPGPVFGITAAVHGNEINGIPVVHRLFDQIDLRQLRGTLVGIPVVNIPAFLNHERTFDDRTDMNHIMPGKAKGNGPQKYAYRFIHRVIRHFDYLVDLHTASFGNINSLYIRADLDDTVAAEMAHLMRPQIILHNPASDRTLRGTATEMGIPSITIEMGDPQVFQPRHIRATLQGVRRVLGSLSMLSGRRAQQESPPPIICSSSQWLYTDHGGLLEVLPDVTDRVKQGEVVARQTDIFGNIVGQYQAPQDGIVIGKHVNPVGQTGARILHLGHLAETATEPETEDLA